MKKTGDGPLNRIRMIYVRHRPVTITYIKRPLSRLVWEGTVGDCPICKSTTLHKHEWGIFGRWGKKIGCVHPECENYYDSKQNIRERKLEKLGI